MSGILFLQTSQANEIMVPSRKLFGVAFVFLLFTNAMLYFSCKSLIVLFRAHEKKQGEMLVFIFYCCATLLIVLAAAINIPLVMKVHMRLTPELLQGYFIQTQCYELATEVPWDYMPPAFPDLLSRRMRMFRSKPELYATFVVLFFASVVSMVVCLVLYNVKQHKLKKTGSDSRSQQMSKKLPLWWKIVTVVLLALWVLLYTYDMLSEDDTLTAVAPPHWFFMKQDAGHKIKEKDLQEAVKMYRAKFPLPDDYDWIDQREDPEYPLVYGPLKSVCAYNPDYERCTPENLA